MINTTENYNEGRFGNQFIRNMGYHFIAKKNNLSVTYENYDSMKLLGIDLFTTGNNYYQENIQITDENFFDYILPNTPLLTKNLKLIPRTTFAHNNEIFYAQTNIFSKYLFNYFQEKQNQTSIIYNNKYKERFNNNKDLFIHVRLGDVPHLNPGFDYYDKILKEANFSKGYISSDSIEHEICQRLINKYNLEIFNQSEINTIMFANTCKYIILSNGSFSWLIGLFGSFYNSKIFYPIPEIAWHGDIYNVSDSWEGIKMSNKYNYVINLDRRDDRYNDFLKTIQGTLSFKNENFIRFSAFDGSNYHQEFNRFKLENEAIISKFKKINEHQKIKDGELGAFLSHLLVLKSISENKDINEEDYVKIFEDDIFISNDFEENYKKLSLIQSISTDINFIYLGGRFLNEFNIEINNKEFYQNPRLDNLYKRNPTQNPGYNIHWDRINCSYMIKKSYSRKLYEIIIQSIEENFLPIDTLYLTLHNKLDFYDFCPHLFWSPLNYKSDIQNSEPKYIDFTEDKIIIENEKKTKVFLVSMWEGFNTQKDIFYLKLFGNNKKIQIINDDIYKSDIVIAGSFINNENANLLLDIYNNHKNIELILYITEPIGNYFIQAFDLLQLNIFKKIFGCIVFNNNLAFKYPLYLNNFENLSNIRELLQNTNSYVKNIPIFNKKFGCLINRHDDGNTRTNIYKLLNTIYNDIECPGQLLNNCPNTVLNEIGNIEYIKQFIFNICPENFKTKFNGYITEKLLNCCLGGAIPIFFGHFDDFDSKIFNKNRIIFFDPENASSLIDTFIFVKNLYENKSQLEQFYRQDVFVDSAYETIMFMENNIGNFLFP